MPTSRSRGVAVRNALVGLLTLGGIYFVVHTIVVKNRKPGSMTVLEAQAMDMTQSGTPVGAVPVKLEEAKETPFSASVTYTGSVVALSDTEIYPRVTGTLKALLVYPGDTVQVGQVIARLDSVELASKQGEAAAAREAASHEATSSQQELRQATAMRSVIAAKIRSGRSAQRDAKAQLAAAEAMREQSRQEKEAAQAVVADAQANLAVMQADADYWRSELVREEKLYASKAVSREEYDRERAQAQAAEAKLLQAQASIKEKQAMIAVADSKIRQADAARESAEAKLSQAQADIEAMSSESDAAVASIGAGESRVRNRQAMVKQARTMEQTAQIVRGYTEIRATEEGIVSERLVSPGTLVQPGMAILRVKRIDKVRLQANVAEADLHGIRVGSSLVAKRSEKDPHPITAHVTSIFGSASTATRTVTVEALVPNPGKALRPGQYLIVQLGTDRPRTAITVPLQAIQRDADNKPFVWTADSVATKEKTIYTCVMHPEVRSDKPGKCPKCGMDLVPMKKGGSLVAHRTPVQLGESNGTRTIVTSGLTPGMQVLTQGIQYLKEGDFVTPTDWGAGGPKALPAPPAQTKKHDDMSGMPGMGGQ